MIATLRHRVGETIQDRYEIENELGSGAFGTVYKCRDRELDTIVAIKELHVLDEPSTRVDERAHALELFRREATHLSNLRHPNIVSGYYQPHNGTWLVCPVCGVSFKGFPTCPEHNAKPIVLKQRNYLVMEYLDGPNLAQATEGAGGVLPLPIALRLIRQTTDALQQVHGRGWVHRDIKPENIRLRTQNDGAVLLDFGIATESGATGEFTTRAVRHTTGGGTLGYAPDSPSERRNPDARSDIHALGMTLYRLVSGRDPQEFDDLTQMRKQAPSTFNRHISPALDILIRSSIHADPNQRPQNAEQFARLLDALDAPIKEAQSTPAPAATPSTPVKVVPIPTLKFYANEEPQTVDQLISLCERRPSEAREYLYAGHLETWLESRGSRDLARRAREVAQSYPKRERGLEAWLQATGKIAPPQLVTNPTFLDFGVLATGQSRTLQMYLRNPGRGYLFGLLKSSHRAVSLQAEFDGNNSPVPITIDASRMDGGEYTGEITIDSSAGEIHVPFRVIIKNRGGSDPLTSVVFWSVVGMFGGFGMRTIPFLQTATPGWDWLSGTEEIKWWPIGPVVGATLFAAATPFLIGESSRRKSCSGSFSLALFAFLFAAFCGLIGNEILRAGDLMLRPLVFDLAHNWAAGGWMFVGGVLGACYGTILQRDAIFSTRLFRIIMGWLVAMAVIYGLLAASVFIAPHT